MRDAQAATTTLRFTVAPSPTPTLIPAGTEVANADDTYLFTTDIDLNIPPDAGWGDVPATRITAGKTVLAADVLTRLADTIEDVVFVTNPARIDSGAFAETIDQAFLRATSRLRSMAGAINDQDLQRKILDDVLAGDGIVRVFGLIADGDWQVRRAGHTTIVVMTRAGEPLSPEVRARVAGVASRAVGAQWIYVRDPAFVDFDVQARLRVTSSANQASTLALAKARLRDYYSIEREAFGRPVLRSDIIAILESTPGVARIESPTAGEILQQPSADSILAPYELARMGTPTLEVA